MQRNDTLLHGLFIFNYCSRCVLDAYSHLYESVGPSVRLLVSPSVFSICLLLSLLVHLLVRLLA